MTAKIADKVTIITTIIQHVWVQNNLFALRNVMSKNLVQYHAG